jgi:outer membrane protein assembly factor BamB
MFIGDKQMKSLRFVLALVLVVACWRPVFGDWRQFGGPAVNFHVDAQRLLDSWPASGPPVVWKRPLGQGYSGITVADGVLYTMYRTGSDEIVLAAKAGSGETLWEHKYAAPFASGMKMENGSGPHVTPLVTEQGVYAVGVLGRLLCLDRNTGKLKWQLDLPTTFGLAIPDRGYSPSPIAYRDMLFVRGGKGSAVIALRQQDGAVVWSSGEFGYSGSTPVLGNVEGFDQLVVFGSDEIAALNPLNGDVQWWQQHTTQYGLNISAPVWGEDGIVFCSSAYGAGSRAVQVRRVGDHVEAEELWFNNQVRVHFTNAIRVGDYVYASSGDFGPAPLTAIQVKTGEIAWRDRTFAKANLLLADGKFILLDEDGTLALVRVSPKGLEVLAKTSLTETRHWTVPTLDGTRLYIRNEREMMALELGAHH